MVNNAGGSEEFSISRVLADTDELSENWENVIPSRPGLSIEDADFFKGRIVVYVRHIAQSFVEDYQLDGNKIKGPFRVATPEATQAGVWSPGANVVSLTHLFFLPLKTRVIVVFSSGSIQIHYEFHSRHRRSPPSSMITCSRIDV